MSKTEKTELIDKTELIEKLEARGLQLKHIDLLFKNGLIPVALKISQKTQLYRFDDVVARLGIDE
jgi:hypothetical protein